MFAILITVVIFPNQEPKILPMPFVMTMERCQKQLTAESNRSGAGITVATVCHPLDRDAVESLRFSADAVLSGVVD